MSNEAETDGERHLRGERQLRRLHRSHRHLHGRRHPQLPLCCGHLVHAGWLVTHFEIFVYMLYLQQAPTYQSLYPGVDNRYLAATDYFAAAGYRSLGTYYPEYAAHAALGNSYLDVSGGSL